MLLPYPRLIHADDKERIAEFRAQYPKLDTQVYTVEEKVEGVPFQLCFSAGGSITLAIRDRILKPEEDMHNIRKALSEPRLQRVFQLWRRWCQTEKKELNVFGVLVNAEGATPLGVDYGADTRLLFFDAVKESKVQSRRAMVELFGGYNCLDYLVPRYATAHSLADALQFSADAGISSKVSGVEFKDNLPAGIVIKPYQISVALDDQGFALKRENDLAVIVEDLEPPKSKITPARDLPMLEEELQLDVTE